ncbi:hypothetical protein POPTR_004G174150v4 [Populus trichocarpa]|uniref:Uncharacterized protein n=1 Tax=Populus trichocarpa TaxID=3694 RepID=A0A3N7GAP6_POPTR|nr:hypothetical protein POPTR_004G174150v4 [Populus trichocarpa]
MHGLCSFCKLCPRKSFDWLWILQPLLAIRHCQCCNRRSPCWCLSGLVPIEMYISQKKIGRWTSQWLARASDFQYELPRDHHSCSLLALLPGLCWISKLTSHAFKSSYRGLRERAMN